MKKTDCMKKIVNCFFAVAIFAAMILTGCNNNVPDNELSDNELSDNELSDNELSDNELSDKITLKNGDNVKLNSRTTTLYKKLVSTSSRAIGDAPFGYEWRDVERNILNVTYPDGQTLSVYEDEEKLEDGSTYMVLSEYKTAKVDERTTAKSPVKTYGYNFCFYEIVNFEDNTTSKLNIEGLEGVIVRNYPSLNMWIYDEEFTKYYGTPMTKAEFAEILETEFESDVNKPDESWWGAAGWSTYDNEVMDWICHLVGSMRFYKGRTFEDLSDNGISIEIGSNGNQNYVYDKIEEPVAGKTYKWLNQSKGTAPETSNDGAYAFYLFEEDNGIVSDYPSLLIIMKPLDNDNFDIHYGDSKVWNGLDDVTVGFEQKWTHDGCWGWGTYNNELGVYVHHRIHTYRYDEIE